MALPGRSLWLPVGSLHDIYQLKWAAGNQGGRCYGTRTPDAGPKRGPKRLRSDPSLRAVADHSAAPRGRFAAILGSLSSESAPRVTSAPHLWTVGPTMASNRQYCVTV